MKKLSILAICMAAVMMACTNKGKTAPGDVNDSDSVATDSLMVEEADTTPKPMFIWMMGGKNMLMHYWANIEQPKKNEDNAEYFDDMMADWSIQDGFRRNRAIYTKLINEDNKCLGIMCTGELLKNPDGDDASYGEIHGREGIPAAGLKYEFTDKKFNAREMTGFYVAVTDEYLASRKLIDMRRLPNIKPLPANVVEQLEGEYKMKTEKSQLVSQGNKYSYGILQFKGKYKTVKEGSEKVDKCLALEVVTSGDKVYSFPVEGNIYDGMCTWHADDDGEYYGSEVTLFEAPDDVIEIAYVKGAPESFTTGMYYIRDGNMTCERYEVYHAMIDEEEPLWKKDVAELQKLFVAANKDNKGHKLCKYRWIDIDNDDTQELWMRAADDKHGALFCKGSGKWQVIGCENAEWSAEFRMDYSGGDRPGYVVIGGAAGGPSIYATFYKIQKSKVSGTLTTLSIYGELDECTLNGKTISNEEAQNMIDAMPKVQDTAIWWHEISK